MSKVIIYRKELLRISETFIKTQAQSYSRWEALLLGERLWPQGLSLDGLRYKTIQHEPINKMSRVLAKIRQLFSIVTPGIKRLLDDAKPDLVHAHFGMDALLAYPYAQYLNVPLVVTLHGHDANVSPAAYRAGESGRQKKSYPDRIERLSKNKNVHFIAVSDALREAAIANYHLPADRMRTYYTGIDTTRFTPGPVAISKRALNIVFVGRLVEVKGCEFLIKAFGQLLARVPDASLTIIGDGPLRASLEALAKPFNHAIRFLGNITPDKVKEIIDHSRVLCLPSVTIGNGSFEAFGMVLLEAQASGVPVVTSARGGVESIIEGVTGFSFPERDVDALTERLQQLLTDDALAERMSQAAPRHVQEHFDLKRCTAKIEGYYDEIMQIHKK